MAGARLALDTYSGEGSNVKWRIVVWDNLFSGSAINYTLNSNGFELVYDSEGDNFTEALKPSYVKFNLKDNGETAFNSFVTALKTAQESQFSLIIYKHDGSLYNLYWVGTIMTDGVSYDNIDASDNAPRDFEIIAKDGLNRAGNIEFDKVDSSPYYSGGVSTPQNLIKIITDCLSYINTGFAWSGTTYGAAATFLRVCTTWKDANMVCDNSTPAKAQNRSLEITRIDRDFLFDHYREDDKWSQVINTKQPRTRGINDPALKVRTVLRDVLSLMGCRLVLADGCWWVTQIAKYTDSSATYAEYDSSGTFLREVTVNLRKTPTVLSDGIFGSYPCLRTARATTLPNDILGQIAEGQILDTDTPNYSTTIQLGTIYGGTDTRIRVHIPIQAIHLFSKYGDVKIKLNVTIICGSYRVKLKSGALYSIGIMEWTTTSTDNYEYSAYFGWMGTVDKMYASVVLETEDIPFVKEENCTMQVEVELEREAPATLPAASLYQLRLQDIAVAVINSANDLYGQITEYVEVNPNTTIGNSIDADYGKINIHDTGIVSNKVSIETDEYVGAGRWTKSTIWDADHTTNTTLIHTILKEAMSLQRTPINKYDGTFRDTYANYYAACYVLSYDSRYWVFQGLKYDSKLNEWAGTWFEINRDTSSLPAVTDLKNGLPTDKVNPIGLGPWNVPPTGYLAGRDVGGTAMPQIKTTLLDVGDIGATFTSIDCDSVDFAHINAGDVINVWHKLSGQLLQQFTVSSDVNIGDTSISVDSTVLTGDINPRAEIGFDSNTLHVSNEVRAADKFTGGNSENGVKTIWLKVLTTGSSSTELTTNGLSGSGVSNRIAVPEDTAISCKLFIVAKQEGQLYCAKFDREFLIVNSGGTTTLQGSVATLGVDIQAVPLATTSVSVTANNSDDAINISVQGVTLTPLNWTARVELTYSKYA